MNKDRRNLIAAGLITGVISAVLSLAGNPANMGFCIACFLRDTAGALQLHNASAVQYVRPEITGLVAGSFLVAVLSKEFKPRGGSSPLLRFVIGAFVMIGALTFLGCPFRMVLRLAGGDLNALVALGGFAVGIATACLFINRGFSLGRYKEQTLNEGLSFPALVFLLFSFSIIIPDLFASSQSGPGSMHAPVLISLIAGTTVGILAQRTRFCMAGGIRDIILIQDSTLITGFIAIFLSALITNLLTGHFKLGFTGQPVSHTAHLWNFLGMYIVGLGSSLLGGCPLRQIILAGEGNTDSALSVLGMFAGAAIAHNFKLVGNATANGPNIYGKSAVCLIIALLLIIAYLGCRKGECK